MPTQDPLPGPLLHWSLQGSDWASCKAGGKAGEPLAGLFTSQRHTQRGLPTGPKDQSHGTQGLRMDM